MEKVGSFQGRLRTPGRVFTVCTYVAYSHWEGEDRGWHGTQENVLSNWTLPTALVPFSSWTDKIPERGSLGKEGAVLLPG